MNDYNFKPFDKVLVRYNSDSTWICDLYSHYSKKNEKYCCVGGFCEYCLPYEGNEHLLGTTDAPKPKRWRAEENGIYYFINAFGDVSDDIDNRNSSNDLYNIGNYFRTEEEARDMADRFKAILKGE